MPDNRRTRELDPQLYPQLVGYPESNPVVDSSGLMLDLGRLNNASEWIPGGSGVKVDPRSFAAGTVPDYVNPQDDSLKSPLQQIPEGLGMIARDVGKDVSGLYDQAKGAISGGLGFVRDGLDALTPSQDTLNEIGMRLQNAHAIKTGQLPMYLQMQMAQQQAMGQQDLMAMKRQQLSQQLEQQQFLQQQKDEDQALSIWKDPHMPLAMQKKISEQLKSRGNVLAGNLARLADEQLIGEMETLQQFLPAGKLGELVNIMRQPNADLTPVEQWRDFARDRKKAYGEAQIKSQRFTELLKAYQNGELDPNGPEYDEFKQIVSEREKKQKEHAEMDLKLQQLGLHNKKAALDLAVESVMPRVGTSIPLAGGKTQTPVFDPQTNQLNMVAGDKPPASVTNVIMKQESAFEGELGKENVKDLKATQQKAKDAATSIATIHQARSLLDSGVITGVGAEYRTKFGQALQQIGFKKHTDKVANTQAFTALMASNVGQMIKQFGSGTGLSDADRDFATKMAGGDITIDEQAIRDILDMNEKAARNIIQLHNKTAQNIKSMIPLTVEEPATYTRPAKHPTKNTVPTIKSDADFDKLPSGTIFIGPDGKKRTKP